MKLLIPRLDLVALVGKVQTVIPSRPPTPILANVLLEALDDQLIISATDLTVSLRTHTQAKVVKEGAIVLPARQFFQLIRELTAPMVEIHVSAGGVAAINAGSSHFKVHGMHAQEFPLLPNLSDATPVVVNSATLKELLSRTAFAAARDTTKPILQSVCFQSLNHTWHFLSTDGKRIAKMHIENLEFQGVASQAYVIPLKAVEEIIRILDEKEEDVKLLLMTDKIAVESGSVTLISKLLSGHYPDVIRVIPDKKTDALLLHREELTSMLRQIVLFTAEKNSSVKFTFSNGELRLSSSDGILGEGSVHMPVNYSGEKLDIAFNPHYFLDVLRHIKDETIELSLIDPYNPGLITDSSTAQFVVMPMRLDAYTEPSPSYAQAT